VQIWRADFGRERRTVCAHGGRQCARDAGGIEREGEMAPLSGEEIAINARRRGEEKRSVNWGRSLINCPLVSALKC
jgi:hypothetical protein